MTGGANDGVALREGLAGETQRLRRAVFGMVSELTGLAVSASGVAPAATEEPDVCWYQDKLGDWFRDTFPGLLSTGAGTNSMDPAVPLEVQREALGALTRFVAQCSERCSTAPERVFLRGGGSTEQFVNKQFESTLRSQLDGFIKLHLVAVDQLGDPQAVAHMAQLVHVVVRLAHGLFMVLGQVEQCRYELWGKLALATSSFWLVSASLLPAQLRDSVQAEPKLQERTRRTYGEIPLGSAWGDQLIDTRDLSGGVRQQVEGVAEALQTQAGGGLLVRGDNHQALRLLRSRYQDSIEVSYIDPPYNTGQDGFCYRDRYSPEAWASMMRERLHAASRLLAPAGVQFVSIDHPQRAELTRQLESAFGADNFIEELIWVQDTVSNNAPAYSTNHEYIEVFARSRQAAESDPEMFRETRPGYGDVTGLMRRLGAGYPSVGSLEAALQDLYASHRERHRGVLAAQGVSRQAADRLDPWKGLYPYRHVEYRDAQGRLVDENSARARRAVPWVWREVEPSMPSGKQAASTRDPASANFRFYAPSHPATGKACKPPKRGWAFPQFPHEGRKSLQDFLADDRIYFKAVETCIPQRKYFLHEVERVVSTSVLRQYADGEPRLEQLFGSKGLMQNPKPPELVERLIRQTARKQSTVLDYFAGSGTTAQAVMGANRADGGQRGFILVEAGEHFHSVLVPRVMKCALSSSWRGGHPTHVTKPLRLVVKGVELESYEQALRWTQRVDRAGAGQGAQAERSVSPRYLADLDRGRVSFDVSTLTWPAPASVDWLETFNLLLGVRVEMRELIDPGLSLVRGELANGRRVVVVWRDRRAWTGQRLLEYGPRIVGQDAAGGELYMNGGLVTQLGGVQWEVRATERALERLLFGRA